MSPLRLSYTASVTERSGATAQRAAPATVPYSGVIGDMDRRRQPKPIEGQLDA